MSAPDVVHVDDIVDMAATFPLDDLADAADKHDRGTVLLVGGSSETPGAMVLAAEAALAAGAGRVQIATVSSIASIVGAAVPEARVIALRADGPDVAADALDDLEALRVADVVLVGPGALDPERASELAACVLERVATDCKVVLDAAALKIGSRSPERIQELGSRVLAVPNVVEAGHLLGVESEWIGEHLGDALIALVERLRCVVALRGQATCSAAPGSAMYLDTSGTPHLATAGSGDVFAGLAAGVCTRTDDLLAVAARAVHAHAAAGCRATARSGGAILARQLSAFLPQCLEQP